MDGRRGSAGTGRGKGEVGRRVDAGIFEDGTDGRRAAPTSWVWIGRRGKGGVVAWPATVPARHHHPPDITPLACTELLFGSAACYSPASARYPCT
ncbi:hypothetical protein GCM10009527_067380 [Actinomadura nitritigenes]